MERIFKKAKFAWDGFERFRTERARCKRYVFGKQLEDTLEYNGRRMTERQYIEEMGQNPMQNNLLRRILRNVTGVYRSSYKTPTFDPSGLNESGDIYSESDETGRKTSERTNDINRKIRRIFKANRMEELTPRLLEEFLISGMSAVKICPANGQNGCDVRILPVTPDNFFFHTDGYDPRGWDVDLIGEVHNVTFSSLMEHLCRTVEEIEKMQQTLGADAWSLRPCRVLEVWYKHTEKWAFYHDTVSSTLRRMPMKEISRLTLPGKIRKEEIRSHYRSAWRSVWFSADGKILKIGEEKESHPYVWKAYPFIDGEVHSYVNDIIDQQRYVNHLITLYDFIMRSSAKGVLLFPDESIPRGWSLEEVADHWSRFNGVIPYRHQPGVPLPTQVSGNAANIGISELLKIEMQMLEDISGVSPTLQGKLENSTSSGTLFAQQSQAAMTSLLDVVRSFEEFVESVAMAAQKRQG